MVDFAANFTIRLLNIVHFTWKVLSLKVVHLPISCQSERSLRYFHLGWISDLLSIHLEFRGSLVVTKQLLWEKLKIRTLKKFRFLSNSPPIQTASASQQNV